MSTHDLHAALTSLYHVTAPDPADAQGPVAMTPVAAARVLAAAAVPGADILRQFAAAELGTALLAHPDHPDLAAAARTLGVPDRPQGPAIETADATRRDTFDELHASLGPCTTVLRSFRIDTDAAHRRARVHFTLEVGHDVQTLRGRLDPRGWSSVGGGYIRRSAPVSTSCAHGYGGTDPAQPGTSWEKGLLDEQFDNQRAAPRIWFDNHLHVDARYVVGPPAAYGFRYSLCASRGSGLDDGHVSQTFAGGLIHDCGFVDATGDASTSVVECQKVVQVEGPVASWVGRSAYVSFKTLIATTAAALGHDAAPVPAAPLACGGRRSPQAASLGPWPRDCREAL